MPVQRFALIDWIFKKKMCTIMKSYSSMSIREIWNKGLLKVNICRFKDKISNNINELLWIYAHLPRVPIRRLDLLLPLAPLLTKASQVFWASWELSCFSYSHSCSPSSAWPLCHCPRLCFAPFPGQNPLVTGILVASAWLVWADCSREEVFMEGPLEPNMGPSLADVLLCTFESTNAVFSSFPLRKLLSWE